MPIRLLLLSCRSLSLLNTFESLLTARPHLHATFLFLIHLATIGTVLSLIRIPVRCSWSIRYLLTKARADPMVPKHTLRSGSNWTCTSSCSGHPLPQRPLIVTTTCISTRIIPRHCSSVRRRTSWRPCRRRTMRWRRVRRVCGFSDGECRPGGCIRRWSRGREILGGRRSTVVCSTGAR